MSFENHRCDEIDDDVYVKENYFLLTLYYNDKRKSLFFIRLEKELCVILN